MITYNFHIEYLNWSQYWLEFTLKFEALKYQSKFTLGASTKSGVPNSIPSISYSISGTTSLDPLTFDPNPLAPYQRLILFDPRSFWYHSIPTIFPWFLMLGLSDFLNLFWAQNAFNINRSNGSGSEWIWIERHRIERRSTFLVTTQFSLFGLTYCNFII